MANIYRGINEDYETNNLNFENGDSNLVEVRASEVKDEATSVVVNRFANSLVVLDMSYFIHVS